MTANGHTIDQRFGGREQRFFSTKAVCGRCPSPWKENPVYWALVGSLQVQSSFFDFVSHCGFLFQVENVCLRELQSFTPRPFMLAACYFEV